MHADSFPDIGSKATPYIIVSLQGVILALLAHCLAHFTLIAFCHSWTGANNTCKKVLPAFTINISSLFGGLGYIGWGGRGVVGEKNVPLKD